MERHKRYICTIEHDGVDENGDWCWIVEATHVECGTYNSGAFSRCKEWAEKRIGDTPWGSGMFLGNLLIRQPELGRDYFIREEQL